MSVQEGLVVLSHPGLTGAASALNQHFGVEGYGLSRNSYSNKAMSPRQLGLEYQYTVEIVDIEIHAIKICHAIENSKNNNRHPVASRRSYDPTIVVFALHSVLPVEPVHANLEPCRKNTA